MNWELVVLFWDRKSCLRVNKIYNVCVTLFCVSTPVKCYPSCDYVDIVDSLFKCQVVTVWDRINQQRFDWEMFLVMSR